MYIDKLMCAFDTFFTIRKLFLKRLQAYKMIWRISYIRNITRYLMFVQRALGIYYLDAQKVEPHVQLSEHPTIIFQRSIEQMVGVE